MLSYLVEIVFSIVVLIVLMDGLSCGMFNIYVNRILNVSFKSVISNLSGFADRWRGG